MTQGQRLASLLLPVLVHGRARPPLHADGADRLAGGAGQTESWTARADPEAREQIRLSLGRTLSRLSSTGLPHVPLPQ